MFKIFLTLCNPARPTRTGQINFRLTELRNYFSNAHTEMQPNRSINAECLYVKYVIITIIISVIHLIRIIINCNRIKTVQGKKFG